MNHESPLSPKIVSGVIRDSDDWKVASCKTYNDNVNVKNPGFLFLLGLRHLPTSTGWQDLCGRQVGMWATFKKTHDATRNDEENEAKHVKQIVDQAPVDMLVFAHLGDEATKFPTSLKRGPLLPPFVEERLVATSDQGAPHSGGIQLLDHHVSQLR